MALPRSSNLPVVWTALVGSYHPAMSHALPSSPFGRCPGLMSWHETFFHIAKWFDPHSWWVSPQASGVLHQTCQIAHTSILGWPLPPQKVFGIQKSVSLVRTASMPHPASGNSWLLPRHWSWQGWSHTRTPDRLWKKPLQVPCIPSPSPSPTPLASVELWAMFDDNLLRQASLQ